MKTARDNILGSLIVQLPLYNTRIGTVNET